ncbi:UDP-N-acetylglucosamine--N-acetylmuramyl-(pentapeptide) pyrophosphoryl-undecaprenol N-acetylglucosamine transferase [Candidatus Kaiserbacteria bacterium]|nr:UDP-N-acetylglucosamine--N-acetylmuramyl-(pentapeptide) pyrophosphoryl-undecaprenol N-acetylglucosamine transferase [Candidatus Kaiserbacteria bacterium]
MRIVLTGSGSGGHFYPLIAIAEALIIHARDQKLLLPELYLMGPEPYDPEALMRHGISFQYVPAGKMRRYFSWKNFTDTARTLAGVCVATWKLFTLYPDVVVSKGSYTSVPVILAAIFLRIPIVIHESDAQPGRANKLVARFARTIAVTYAGDNKYFPAHKVVRTGIPTRSHLLTPGAGDPYEQLQFDAHRDLPLILVLGGSQGAERINDLIATSLDVLLSKYVILHQTGESHATIVTETAQALTKEKSYLNRYHVRGFLDVTTLAAALRAAALVISRAGSGSINEIALAGKPSILIPIPEEISHDQRLNAYTYARTGAAIVMEEKNLTPHLLAAEISRIIGDQAIRLRMQEAARAFAPVDAAKKIAEILIEIGLEHER